jgi:hypothetical protein
MQVVNVLATNCKERRVLFLLNSLSFSGGSVDGLKLF